MSCMTCTVTDHIAKEPAAGVPERDRLLVACIAGMAALKTLAHRGANLTLCTSCNARLEEIMGTLEFVEGSVFGRRRSSPPAASS